MIEREQLVGRVVRHVPLCREHYLLVVGLDAFAPTEPGQFVQVACRPSGAQYMEQPVVEWSDESPAQPPQLHGSELLGWQALLRRPISLAGRRDLATGVELDLIYREIGVGTRWLTGLQTGDAVDLIGPLGHGFVLPAENEAAILIGGGVGIPPMMYLSQKLVGPRGVVFCGAVNRDLLPLTITADAPPPPADTPGPQYNIAEFAQYGLPAVCCTDDGSYGFRGFVTQALEPYLAQYFPSGGAMLYTCGPEPMMKRVSQIAERFNLPCQVSVERAMACGLGTCQSCVIRVENQQAAEGWSYQLTCTDGPVFNSRRLRW